MVFDVRRKDTGPQIPVGTQWILDTVGSGTWEVPATGEYEIELHGGGSGGGSWNLYNQYATGSGSGKIANRELQKGDKIPVTIGAGGSALYGTSGYSGDGGATTFGDLSVAGAKGVRLYYADAVPGANAGNISSAGKKESIPDRDSTFVYGGLGNVENPSQKYGNGGWVNWYSAGSGENGAVIITFMGA